MNGAEWVRSHHPEWDVKVEGDWLQVKECPLCHGVGSNNEYCFRISIEKSYFHCWRGKCGAHGSIDDLAGLLGDREDVREVVHFHRDRKTGSFPLEMVERWQNALKVTAPAISFLKKRGFEGATADHFKLGYDQGCITIPHIDHRGVCTMVKKRKIEVGEKEAKYVCEKGSTSVLFNDVAVDQFEDVIVTEGEFDCMALWQMGFKNVVSLPSGCDTCGPETVERLRKPAKVTLFMDSDRPGQDGAREVAKRLGYSRTANVDVKKHELTCKDANELMLTVKDPADMVKVLLHSSAPFDMEYVKPLSMMIDESFSQKVEPPEITTPWTRLDYMFGGFYPGRLVALTAPAKIGKTSLALNIAVHNAKRAKPVLVFNLEMRPPELMRKSLACLFATNLDELAEEHRSRFKVQYPNFPLYFASRPRKLSFESVAEIIREATKLYGLKLVIFDHLHFLVRSAENVAAVTSLVSRQFKMLAEELEIPILLIVQLRKLNRDRIGTIDDMKDSSSIGQDADDNICLYRKRRYMDLEDGQDENETDSSFSPEMTLSVDASRWQSGGRMQLFFREKQSLFLPVAAKRDVEIYRKDLE